MPLISSLLPVPQDVGLLPAHGNGFGQIPFLLPPMTHQQELNPGSLGASPLPMSHRCCMECNRKSSEMTTVKDAAEINCMQLIRKKAMSHLV